MIIAETERLILRELNVSDAKDFYELNTDPEVLKYTGDSPFSSISEAENFLGNYTDYQKNGFGRWAVVLKESNQFIGWCGLKLNEENLVDIGFRFFQTEWGKGYATESALACIAYGFHQLQLKKIIGRASKDNLASLKVLEKIGMKVWKEDSCEGIENAIYYQIEAK
ncbi:GNAT family N-acetyltransferase [Sediminitomix flava]|uniref:RimJ/RimL family protein N-acetyltransferase n=1 Tax=Sediminitomix flava TaxID=379075 RepID=A0A315ZIU8_SEDFL|nr:GNAT family N-acetyltransferase [Sediminitomix flava]PWJ44748.1 RimJ/RimL family protein N-acetyltransferase [Sediminitomix flava]